MIERANELNARGLIEEAMYVRYRGTTGRRIGDRKVMIFYALEKLKMNKEENK